MKDIRHKIWTIFIIVFSVPMFSFTQEMEVYTVVEKMPTFGNCEDIKNDDKYLFDKFYNNINYCSKHNIENYLKEQTKTLDIEITNKEYVYVSFVIDTLGNVVNARIGNINNDTLATLSPIEQKAIEIIENMTGWVAGSQRGKKVNVQYTLPIEF